MNPNEDQSSNNWRGNGHGQQKGKEPVVQMKVEIEEEDDLDDDFTKIDDFLRNFWDLENPFPAADTIMDVDDPMIPICNNVTTAPMPPPPPPPPPIIQQPTLARVWFNNNNQKQQQPPPPPNPCSHNWASSSSSSANMTLEDFLIKAGVLLPGKGSSSRTAPPAVSLPMAHPAAQFQLPNFQQMGFPGGRVMGMKYEEYYYPENSGNVNAGSPAAVGISYLKAGSPREVYGGEGSGGRREIEEVAVEVQRAMERRRKRMIKNRESAARSRAKKQAYTLQLESECDRMRKENEALQLQRQELLRQARLGLVQAMEEKAKINAKNNAGSLRRCKSCA